MQVISEFSIPEVGVRGVHSNTAVFVAPGEVPQFGSSNGVLYVTESCLQYWDASTGTGFTLEYPAISLHAVSRDLDAFPSPCIYCQLQQVDEDDEDEDAIELRLCPQDHTQLDAIFAALSECQALHPDAVDECDGEMFYAGDEPDMTADGEATRSRLEDLLVDDGGEFEEEDDGENGVAPEEFEDAD